MENDFEKEMNTWKDEDRLLRYARDDKAAKQLSLLTYQLVKYKMTNCFAAYPRIQEMKY